MVLMKLKGKDVKGGVTYIKGGLGHQARDAYLEVEVTEPGIYHFYIEMEWKLQECYKDYQIAATCYGASELQFVDKTF